MGSPKDNFLITISDKIDSVRWDSLVKSLPEGTIFQTTYWANYLKEWIKCEPLYLIVKNRENKVVAALLFLKESYFIQFLARKPFSFFTTFLAKKIVPFYSWREGPLVFDKENQQEILNAIFLRLKEVAKNNAVSGSLPVLSGQEEMKALAIKNGFQIKDWATFLIDLTPEENFLMNNLDRAARRMIKKCKEEGIIVEKINDKNELKKYYEILLETRKRLGFGLPPNFPEETMWRNLKGGATMEVFVAKKDGKWLSALGIVGFNGVITEMAVAQSNFSLENKIYANDLIKWEIIKWGHENGYRIYDLAGVSPNPANKKEKGIYQFKAKWGGKLINYTLCSLNDFTYSKSALLKQIIKRTFKPLFVSKNPIKKLFTEYEPKHYWGDDLDVRYYICKLASKIYNKKILDVGCQMGIILNSAGNTNEKFGIDLDENAIDIAKNMAKDKGFKANYKVYDLTKFKKEDFADEKFDIIFFNNMIEVMPKIQRVEILNNILSLLSKNGILYLTTPNRSYPGYQRFEEKLTLEELKELLDVTGLTYEIFGWNPFQSKYLVYGIRLAFLRRIIFKILEFLMKHKFNIKKSLSFFVIIKN
jgi:lipid II:glycine glycyltransferase (peptidoglycan interpeptide bridge formation enzyme)